jgi:hypothetical protein
MSLPLALFCCSYRRDFLRCQRLMDSIRRFNVESLPVFLSVPAAEVDLFAPLVKSLPSQIIAQEDLWAATPSSARASFFQVPGGLRQQVLKSEAWRIVDARTLLVLDSDCVFLRPFFTNDMLSAEDGAAFTVAHDGSSYLDFVRTYGPRRGLDEHEADRNPIRRFFGNDQCQLDFGYAPFIWSRDVWCEFERRYLLPAQETVLEFFKRHPQEFTVYGEALLATGIVPFRPIPPLFRPYHYEHEYWLDQWQGVDEAHIAQRHVGVVYQSNWQFALDYMPHKKSWASRVALQWRRLSRWVLTRARFLSRLTPR